MKYIICLISICLFLSACGGNQKPVDLTAQSEKQNNKYQYSTVSEKAMSSSAQLPGQLVPFNEVNIFPKVNGFVKQLFVDRGSIVKKGQLLMILEAPEMESQLAAAASQYDQAKENAEASQEKIRALERSR